MVGKIYLVIINNQIKNGDLGKCVRNDAGLVWSIWRELSSTQAYTMLINLDSISR